MKFSVIIMTRNRCEDLKFTIQRFLDQTWPNKEIIVIDNASEDSTPQMMKETYPDVRYVRLPDNIDVKAFNIGVALTDGDLLWRTDDDSSPESNHAMEMIIEKLNNDPSIDILAMTELSAKNENRVMNWFGDVVDFNREYPNGIDSHTFVGAGAVIKRHVIDSIGGFDSFGFEELDLSTRAIIAGFRIVYFPEIRYRHFSSMGGRLAPWRWAQMSKQYIRYQAKYFKGFRCFGRCMQIFCYQIIIAMFSGIKIKYIIEGMFGMLYTAIHTVNHNKTPLPKDLIGKATANRSLFKSQMDYFTNVIKRKLKK